MICFQLLPLANHYDFVNCTTLGKEHSHTVLVLTVSSRVGPGPVWTKVLVMPSVLCQIEPLLLLPKIQEECVKGPSLEYRPYVPK